MKKGKYILVIFLIFFVLILITLISFVYYEFRRPPTVKPDSYLGCSRPLYDFIPGKATLNHP